MEKDELGKRGGREERRRSWERVAKVSELGKRRKRGEEGGIERDKRGVEEGEVDMKGVKKKKVENRKGRGEVASSQQKLAV